MSYEPPSRSSVLALIFGVFFPAATILIELLTGLCADVFFDPLPTWGHVVLVAMVPLVNLLLWRSVEKELAPPEWLLCAAGAGVTISAVYTLLLLPVMPVALVATIFFGIGLLPFAPLFTLVAGIHWTMRLGRWTPSTGRRAVLGAGLGLLLLLAVDLSASSTYLALGWARGDVKQERRAVALMHSIGDKEMLLRLCYGDTGRVTGLLSAFLSFWAGGPSGDGRVADSIAARELFFRVTGTAFNAVERPGPGHGRGWDFSWDEDQGGETVGGRVQGLSLASSRIDGSVATIDNLGYFEWTAEVANASDLQHEARLTLALPEGAVASRATLWVNGEPREASVARRSDARGAYEKVVTARRDPLLVTTAGAGRLLVQAFPIQPGSRIKFRVGYTAPFRIAPDGSRSLALPAIVERNFAITSDLKHSVWIEGDAGPGAEFRQQLSDNDLLARRPAITAPRIVAPSTHVGVASASGEHAALHVEQTIARAPLVAPETLMILLDGSAANAGAGAALKRALDTIPAGRRVGLIIAGEQSAMLAPAPWSDDQRNRFEQAIAATRFEGGQDNVAALTEALANMPTGNGALLWIHGPQPVAFTRSAARLEQVIERSARLPGLIRYQLVPGRAFHETSGTWFETARMLSPTADPAGDLRDILAELSSFGAHWRITRAKAGSGATTGSEHIVRLWAADEINAAAAARGSDRDKAVMLAHRLNLVTAVSGAVVLETDRDYKENGLPVPSPDDVPTVPEPGTWALLLVVLLLSVWQMRRHRARGALA